MNRPLASVFGSFLSCAAKSIPTGSTLSLGLSASYFFRGLDAMPTWLFSFNNASMRPREPNISNGKIKMKMTTTYARTKEILWASSPTPRTSRSLLYLIGPGLLRNDLFCTWAIDHRHNQDAMSPAPWKSTPERTFDPWDIRQGNSRPYLSSVCKNHID